MGPVCFLGSLRLLGPVGLVDFVGSPPWECAASYLWALFRLINEPDRSPWAGSTDERQKTSGGGRVVEARRAAEDKQQRISEKGRDRFPENPQVIYRPIVLIPHQNTLPRGLC